MKKTIFPCMVLFLIIISSIACYLAIGKENYKEVEVTFTPSNIPGINARIDRINTMLRIDTGSNFLISLEEPLINQLNLLEIGHTQTFDLFKNIYQIKKYEIPKIKILGKILNKPIAYELSKAFKTNTTIYEESLFNEFSQKFQGSIGLPLCQRFFIFYDFPQSRIYLYDKKKYLMKKHSDQFASLPFYYENKMVYLHIDTDLGTLRFVLDTGCTKTIVKKATDQNNTPVAAETSCFQLSDHDFGRQKFFYQQFNLDNTDGVLGMDFLKKHAFFFDFEENKLYIQK